MLVKICGLTKAEEADYLNDNDADWAGFVLFYPKSRRCVSVERAGLIMKRLKPGIRKVAVVVSPSAEQLSEICDAGFDYVQIHGSLPADIMKQTRIPIIRAFNRPDIEEYMSYWDRPEILGYLFDSPAPGSGQSSELNKIKKLPRDGKLFIIAGGINADNVKAAIDIISPDGVDVSSGVERDGEEFTGKDPVKVAKFIKAAKN